MGLCAVRRPVRFALAALALSACAPAAGGHAEPPATSTPPPVPTAAPVAPDPRVGAVFLGGGDLHACTASVLDAPSGDLILTAAHCLSGGTDAAFVPGFAGGDVDDAWHVDSAFFDPRWLGTQDPAADFAVARVSRADGAGLEATAGGGLRPGPAPAAGTDITVIGYPMGVGGGPASCHTRTSPPAQGFPEVRCAGVVGGFSGAPWLNGSTVSGVIGGLDGGGCADVVSYSPPFDGAVAALMARAEAGGSGDDAPVAFDDGCE
jgi:hypothetical protein